MYQTIERIAAGHDYSVKCGCQTCREETGTQILTVAVKTLDMTDKQIVTACKPKPLYYRSMSKWSRRTCLWCRWNTYHYDRYGRLEHGESIEQLEAHYMDNHASI